MFTQSVEVYQGPEELARAGARRVRQAAAEAAARSGVFSIALAGGSTPRRLYTLMAADPEIREAMPWSRIHFFFGDERHVPPANLESNYRMADEAMFQHLAGERLSIHRVPAEQADASAAAALYGADLERFFTSQRALEGGFPRFDLVLLGMGTDGHTASLFPGTAALGEEEKWVVANWVEKFKAYRITLTLPVLNNASEVIVYVAGAEKAPIIAKVLEPAVDGSTYPVGMIKLRSGHKRWMLDASAASLLAD